jgi:hypothetical protein
MQVGDLVRKSRFKSKGPNLFLVVETKATTHFKPQQRIRLVRCSDGVQSRWVNPINYEVLYVPS